MKQEVAYLKSNKGIFAENVRLRLGRQGIAMHKKPQNTRLSVSALIVACKLKHAIVRREFKCQTNKK